MNSLERVRRLTSNGTIGLIWVNFLMLVAAQAASARGIDMTGLAAGLVLAGLVTAWWVGDRTGATYRIVSSMALAVQVAMLVYALDGSALQIDMHMYFFATLAIAACWVDWRAITGYAALVAVHHLLLYFLLPAAVFPGESDFSRVLLHAVILVLQAGVVIVLVSEIDKAFSMAGKATQETLAANREAMAQAENARRTSVTAEEERAAREREKAADAEGMISSVDTIARGLQELASGNLAFRISEVQHERVDGLRQSFNESLERLEWVMAEVGEAAQTVRADTMKINNSNEDLSHRSEQQAVSVEETAAALSEVTTTVRETARRAENVGRLVGHTRSNAEHSAGVVTNAVAAMGKIEESSRQISQIIGVIDEIAFQTNLLALNAGVEAARAGDAGRGFAVVAQEVRELAQRSANAAKEIKVLINTSGVQVKQGVQLVAETGGALNTIAKEVNDIASHVQAIVLGARDQAIGLESINNAISGIDQNTQRNAAMVQSSTAAVQSLAREAETLEQLLARFKVASARQQAGHRRAA